MLGVFFKDKSEYTSELNVVNGYMEQIAMYISVKTGMSIDEAKKKAISIIKERFNDKEIRYFEREENGDRVVKTGSLLKYIRRNISDKNVFTPTFTSYMSRAKEKSMLSEFIFVNVKARAAAKKVAQKAKAEGNTDLFISKNIEQMLKKIDNNSLSGIFGLITCILYNPTAHNTLTSMTRTTTSLSNASNERLIGGNRYYPRPIDVFNNIVYVSTYCNIEAIRNGIETYGLVIPSVDDVVSVLKYSSDLYFNDNKYYETKIVPYLEKLNPYQRAAIVYTGDLYHLRVYNDQVMRGIISELTCKIDTGGNVLDSVEDLYKIDASILCYAHHIFFSDVKGYGKDYEKMNKAGIASSILATCEHFKNTLVKHKVFFNTFFMTDIFPPNSFRLKGMRRRVVVLSDTDSTCFTMDEWVKWYKGEYRVDDESIALAGCISYITTQSIVNSLAILSKNLGIDTELLHTLEMKNEYLWTVHVPAEVSKHYFASTAIQEGNVFPEEALECKGQLLKNSAMPVHIIKDGIALMKEILAKVGNNEKLQLNDIIKRITDIEKDIIESVSRGESVYLRRSKVKNKEAYTQDEFKSPYQRHTFWEDVFASKYGHVTEPPYDVIKIPTTLTTSTAVKAWIDSIEDTELKDRLVAWLTTYKKSKLPTVYIHDGHLASYGIPKEIYSIINIKKIVLDTTMQHRTILETLGVILNDELTITEQFM